MHRDDEFQNPPPHRRGALAIIRNERHGVLLVQKSYRGGQWGLPGGLALAGEFPHEAWIREVEEETGLLLKPGRLLVVDCIPRDEETGSEAGTNFVFDGGRVSSDAEIRLPDALPGEEPELTDYRFVDTHELGRFVTPLTERRTRAAVAALKSGEDATAYLVEGLPPVTMR
ncbi:NUDIX domain-containing protein [Streptomyces mirabilis]|uniref:NUDIX domain-containing protein n=1 Tax=Streptomyces mirabilis TaxID=68239 RepID=UPI00364F8AE7